MLPRTALDLFHEFSEMGQLGHLSSDKRTHLNSNLSLEFVKQSEVMLFAHNMWQNVILMWQIKSTCALHDNSFYSIQHFSFRFTSHVAS